MSSYKGTCDCLSCRQMREKIDILLTEFPEMSTNEIVWRAGYSAQAIRLHKKRFFLHREDERKPEGAAHA
jgi:hypothetical protein